MTIPTGDVDHGMVDEQGVDLWEKTDEALDAAAELRIANRPAAGLQFESYLALSMCHAAPLLISARGRLGQTPGRPFAFPVCAALARHREALTGLVRA